MQHQYFSWFIYQLGHDTPPESDHPVSAFTIKSDAMAELERLSGEFHPMRFVATNPYTRESVTN